MSKLNKPGIKILAGVVLAVLVLVVVYFAFPQLRKSPTKTAAFSSLQAGASATNLQGSEFVAFVSETSGNPEIYTMQSDGSNVSQLTQGVDKCYSPAWSPNGKYIAFIKESDGKSSLYIMNADGSSQKQISENTSQNLAFQWSPDGQMIEFSESNAGDSNASSIYVSDSIAGIVVKTIDEKGNNLLGGWSPDSKQIVYAKEDSASGKYAIYMVKNDGSDQKVLGQVDGSIKIVGWQDENHFIAVSNQVDLWELYRFNSESTQPEKITSYNDSGIVAWFASSNTLTYVTNQSESWTWHKIYGNASTPLSTWTNYAGQC
jgi:TolB protein